MNTLTFSDAPTAAHLSKITPTDRRAHGKQLRGAVPRAAHDEWRARSDRADPISILRANRDEVPTVMRIVQEASKYADLRDHNLAVEIHNVRAEAEKRGSRR